MARPSDESALSFDGVITVLARQRSRMQGVEYSDLVQEGYLEVWTRLLNGETPTDDQYEKRMERHIINAMRRYMRASREGRAVVYETKISSSEPVPS